MAERTLPIGAPVPNPEPRPVPGCQALEGETVVLQPMDPARDAARLFAASHGSPENEALWTYMPGGPFESEAALRDWYAERAAAGDPVFYTVTDKASGMPVGVVSYLRIAAEHGSIEIGHIWYTPVVQRSNVNTESCYLLLRHAFDDLGYRRMEWKCDALNARSRAAALRLGFQFEGVFRQHLIVRGRNRDTAWFSVLDSEWPGLKAAFERWLGWDESAGPRPSLADLTRAANPAS